MLCQRAAQTVHTSSTPFSHFTVSRPCADPTPMSRLTQSSEPRIMSSSCVRSTGVLPARSSVWRQMRRSLRPALMHVSVASAVAPDSPAQPEPGLHSASHVTACSAYDHALSRNTCTGVRIPIAHFECARRLQSAHAVHLGRHDDADVDVRRWPRR